VDAAAALDATQCRKLMGKRESGKAGKGGGDTDRGLYFQFQICRMHYVSRYQAASARFFLWSALPFLISLFPSPSACVCVYKNDCGLSDNSRPLLIRSLESAILGGFREKKKKSQKEIVDRLLKPAN